MIFIFKKQQFDSVTILGEHAEIDSLGAAERHRHEKQPSCF